MKRTVKQIAAALLFALALANTAHAASSFPDVSGNASYAEAVEYLNDIGVMQGDGNGNFNPDKPVSRAEMAAIICRVIGETENLSTASTFTDVPVSHWANTFIIKAAELGIINGYGNGQFGPSDSVKYEQAVTMIVRAAGWHEEIESIDEIGGYPNGFIKLAQEHSLLSDVTAKKGDILSRAAVASILYNYFAPPFMRT